MYWRLSWRMAMMWLAIDMQALAGEPTAPVVALEEIASYETEDTVYGAWKIPRRLITREGLEQWLRRMGELKEGERLFAATAAETIPAEAVVTRIQHRTWMHWQLAEGMRAEWVLDQLETAADRERTMTPSDEEYGEFLGEGWRTRPREEQIALVCERIGEIIEKYHASFEVSWFEVGDILTGIIYYDHWDNLWDGPLDVYELVDLARRAGKDESSPVLVDRVWAGRRCIVIDAFLCPEIPFQHSSLGLEGGAALEPLGIVEGRLVLGAERQLLLYDLGQRGEERERRVERRELDLPECQQTQLGIVEDRIYAATVEYRRVTAKGGEGSVVTLRRGKLEIPGAEAE